MKSEEKRKFFVEKNEIEWGIWGKMFLRYLGTSANLYPRCLSQSSIKFDFLEKKISEAEPNSFFFYSLALADSVVDG